MPLASPWDSLFVVNRWLSSAAWPQNETAELVHKALANFRGSDRRFPTAVRNRRSDLGDLFSRSHFGGLIGGSETADGALFLSGPFLRFGSAIVAAE